MVLAVTVVVTVVVSVPCAKEIKRAACRRARMVKTMLGSRYLLLRWGMVTSKLWYDEGASEKL
jgi:hypothetical protein